MNSGRNEMSELDADVDAWADALGGSGASDPEDAAGEAEIMVERRTDREDRSTIGVRIRDPTGGVSSVALSPAEARTLAGQLATAAGEPDRGDAGPERDARAQDDA